MASLTSIEAAVGRTPEKVPIHSSARPSLYRPELDAVRFLAFLLIFTFHNVSREPSHYAHARFGDLSLAIVRTTGYGLQLFFALSAYLISDLLIRERQLTGSVDIPSFYKRRILRIWPLYILGLAIGWIASWQSGHPETARFLSFFFIVGNWYVVRFGVLTNPMTPLWSISVEEQFYLFWPAVARKCSEKGMYVVCGALILVANLFLVYLGYARSPLDHVVWCNTFVQFEMFAAGILLALVLRQTVPDFTGRTRMLLLLGAVCSWFFSGYFCKPNMWPAAVSPVHLAAGYAFIALGCALILLAALGLKPGTIPKWVSYLGRISYGLYVFHELAMGIAVQLMPEPHPGILEILSKFLGLGITVIFAAASYRFFEMPFLKLKSRLELIKTRPA